MAAKRAFENQRQEWDDLATKVAEEEAAAFTIRTGLFGPNNINGNATDAATVKTVAETVVSNAITAFTEKLDQEPKLSFVKDSDFIGN